MVSKFGIYFMYIVSSSALATQVKRSWDNSGWTNHCVLPPCPDHAKYEVTGVIETWHGERWPTEVQFTCWPGYTLVGPRCIVCYDGRWSDQTPRCVVGANAFTSHNFHQQQLLPQQQQIVPQHQQTVPQHHQIVPQQQEMVPQQQQIVPQHHQMVPQQQHFVPQQQQIVPQQQEIVPQQHGFVPQLQQCVPQPEYCVPQPQQCVQQTQQREPQSQRLTSPQLKSQREQLRITSPSTGGCILPPYPDKGNYIITIQTNTVSSNHRLTTNLTYTCYDIYEVEGPSSILCLDGSWSDNIPYCKIKKQGQTANAIVSGYSAALTARRGQLPWHVGVYDKTLDNMQICGGTLISNNRAISAAHCFWDDLENQRPASEYAVAAGKMYPAWNDSRDTDSQKSDVREIKIPPRYQHGAADFQEDIALMMLTNAVTYGDLVMPATLDFSFELDSKHLQDGNLGKVGGWGLVTKFGKPASDLQTVQVPNIGIERCIAENEPGFRNYVTSDKICAGYRNGTAACKGDSGGGLVFTEDNNGSPRHYLRGIVSTAPGDGNECNIFAWTLFTHVLRHEHFIKPWLAA